MRKNQRGDDKKISCRMHGEAPFTVAVIHGGPGGAGEMVPVARELSQHYGVLEPLSGLPGNFTY